MEANIVVARPNFDEGMHSIGVVTGPGISGRALADLHRYSIPIIQRLLGEGRRLQDQYESLIQERLRSGFTQSQILYREQSSIAGARDFFSNEILLAKEKGKATQAVRLLTAFELSQSFNREKSLAYVLIGASRDSYSIERAALAIVCANHLVKDFRIMPCLKDKEVLIRVGKMHDPHFVEIDLKRYIEALVKDACLINTAIWARNEDRWRALTYPKALLMTLIAVVAGQPYLVNHHKFSPVILDGFNCQREPLLKSLCRLYERAATVLDRIECNLR